MRCMFERRGDVLVPADPEAFKLVESVKNGAGISVEARRARNIKFHRKFFSLLSLAYDMWEPPADRTHNGEPIRKNMDRFREDVLILAGHYEASYSLSGDVQLEAKSIAFSNCDEHEFRGIYDAVLDVVWERIFQHTNFASKDEVERVTNQLLSY